jgi:IclR family pca regulon transcriptional regulator
MALQHRQPIKPAPTTVRPVSSHDAHSHGSHQGNPDFVLSLARGLDIIKSFEGRLDGVTIAEVAQQTGMSRAAVRRFLLTLEMLGYAENNGRSYRLTSYILKLGFSYLSSTPLTVYAQTVLDSISAAVHESSSMAILEGDEIVYLARSSAVRVMSIGLSTGSRLPAYCTSMGRVLLASLSPDKLADYLGSVQLAPRTPKTVTSKTEFRKRLAQIPQDGYAIVDEELELGLRSIAIPVRTRGGQVIAAINVGAPAVRTDLKSLKKMLPVLRQGAESLAQHLR